jgi:hypothetical protein
MTLQKYSFDKQLNGTDQIQNEGECGKKILSHHQKEE